MLKLSNLLLVKRSLMSISAKISSSKFHKFCDFQLESSWEWHLNFYLGLVIIRHTPHFIPTWCQSLLISGKIAEKEKSIVRQKPENIHHKWVTLTNGGVFGWITKTLWVELVGQRGKYILTWMKTYKCIDLMPNPNKLVTHLTGHY